MKISVSIAAMPTRRAFTISRGEKRVARNVFVRLEDGVHAGYGEASPNPFYGENPERTAELIRQAAPSLEKASPPETAEDVATLWNELWTVVGPSRAAQCALDLALWDLLGKRLGMPVSRLAVDAAPAPVTTFCTIGLCPDAEIEGRLAEVAGFPLLKIKSDATADLDRIHRIAEYSGARVSVDANCAWEKRDLRRLACDLATIPALFLEQPLPPEADASMESLHRDAPLPLFADESCATLEQVDGMPDRFHGFNIKLVKCGGLTGAVRMLRRGRALGLQVMTGCMLESSLLIAAGMAIATECDYADLDGAWLLADDPFSGVSFNAGRLEPSGEPGLGVAPIRDLW